MKLINVKTGLAALSLVAAMSAQAIPLEITFSNNTNLAFNTSIAGLPGNGISANESRAVSYGIVTMGCSFGNVLSNCPIEFVNRDNGDHVATVVINANTATLVGPPTFYGEYGDQYEVQGWDASPISHITFSSKA